MKKNIFIFFALLVLCSCSERFKTEEEKYVQFSVRVSLDTSGVSTKTYMTDDVTNKIGKVKWSATDFLTLINENAYYVKGIHSAKAKDISTDGASATFCFKVTQKAANSINGYNNYLFYGDTTALSASVGAEGLSFSVSLPANQTHAGTACFQEYENISFGYCPTGSFAYNNELGDFPGTAECTMYNAFGILKVPIRGISDPSTIRYVRLTDKTSGQYLAGTFSVETDNNGIPTLNHMSGTGGESRTIEKYITKENPLTTSNPYVYFLVPPGTLFGTGGFNLAVYTDNGWYGSKTIKNNPNSTTANTIERSKITQLELGPFVPKTYVPVIESLSANSYIFDSAEGLGTFPAHYKGNGFQGNGGDIQPQLQANEIPYNSNYYAEIIWQTKCNGETLLAAEVVDSPVYYNSQTYGPCITFHKSGVPGNALIALRNPGKKVSAKQLDGTYKDVDEILWSWHVWITTEYDNTNNGVMLTKQSDGSNVITIMDRNLGALYANPTVSGFETQTHGLAYQFGRKDPYMGSRYTYSDQTTLTEYRSFASIYPPTAIYCVDGTSAGDFSIASSILFPYQRSLRSNGDWCNTLVSWGDLSNGKIDTVTFKKLYDPCPVGWRTFEEKNIVAALGKDGNNRINPPEGEVVKSGNAFAFKLNNNKVPIYFPAGGYAEATTAVNYVGAVMALWGSNYGSIVAGQSQHTQANYIHLTLKEVGTGSTAYESEVKALDMKATMPVRCQKWKEPTAPVTSQTGDTPTYVEDNEEVIL